MAKRHRELREEVRRLQPRQAHATNQPLHSNEPAPEIRLGLAAAIVERARFDKLIWRSNRVLVLWQADSDLRFKVPNSSLGRNDAMNNSGTISLADENRGNAAAWRPEARAEHAQ